MTICLATDSFPPKNSGIATHNGYLVKLLQQAGHTVVILTVDFEDRRASDMIRKEDGLTIITLKKSYSEQYNYFKSFVRTGNREAVVWLSLGTAMRKWLLANNSSYGFDIIETSDYGGYALFLVDVKLPPVVVMCHGTLTQFHQHEFYNEDENLQLIKFLEANLMRHADAVICHSENNVREIESLFGRKALYATAAWITGEVPAIPGQENQFLVVGRLTIIKGALIVAHVMKKLAENRPDMKIVWIGDDSYTAPAGWIVTKYIRKYFPSIWQKNFIWRKGISRKELLKMMNESRIIVIPSRWETFNYVALEAANHKKPMIITKQAGISTYFEHGKDVLVADADNINSIADAMLQLDSNEQLCRELGENAFVSLARNFNNDKFISDRTEAYQAAVRYRNINPPLNPLGPLFKN